MSAASGTAGHKGRNGRGDATTGDPVEAYTTRLAAALHGPAKDRARMVEEIHGGLVDATEAYVQAGTPPEEAPHRAVRDFGPVEKVARACQGELTLVQARHTARAAALTVPLLLACCYLTRSMDALAAFLVALAVISAVLAGTTLATTGVLARWMPVPRRLPTVVAWAGTGTSLAMALTTLAVTATAFLTAAWPLLLMTGALTATCHGILSATSRTCRRCTAA
jgi:hypothetical protein